MGKEERCRKVGLHGECSLHMDSGSEVGTRTETITEPIGANATRRLFAVKNTVISFSKLVEDVKEGTHCKRQVRGGRDMTVGILRGKLTTPCFLHGTSK